MRRCVALRARREFIESLADRRFGCQSAQTPVTRRKSKDSGDGELRVRELAPLTVDVAFRPFANWRLRPTMSGDWGIPEVQAE